MNKGRRKIKQKRVGARALARRLVAQITHHGVPRHMLKGTVRNSSVGTERVTRDAVTPFIRWLRAQGKDWHQCLFKDVDAYLSMRSRVVRQSTLNSDRLAIGRVFGMQIPFVLSLVPTKREPRALQKVHVEALVDFADDNFTLSIELCVASGLRASELLTIASPEQVAEDVRDWHPSRFQGREEFDRYVVTGKGGLKRMVAVPQALSARLEAKKLPAPERFVDRECHGDRYYDLIGGHSASNCFGKLSLKVLGFSTGLHGLRHTFAQTRILELQLAGLTWSDALQVLSCELGHFSTTNTMTYLR